MVLHRKAGQIRARMEEKENRIFEAETSSRSDGQARNEEEGRNAAIPRAAAGPAGKNGQRQCGVKNGRVRDKA